MISRAARAVVLYPLFRCDWIACHSLNSGYLKFSGSRRIVSSRRLSSSS
jgi:hypothetical protein